MSKNNSSRGRLNVLRALAAEGAHVHFLGVGGVSMSSLFALSRRFGISVSGEDRAQGEYIRTLACDVGDVWVGEHRPLPGNTTLLVYSLAVSEDDAALREAEEKGIMTVSRAEYMSALVEPYKFKVAVSGTHGKSTVTSMLHTVFKAAGLLPTTLSGAPLSGEMCHFSHGSLDYLIFESCEYKDSFLYFTPDVGVFLNLELDHPDYFKSAAQLSDSFLTAMKRARLPVVYAGDPALRKIAEKLDTPPIYFGEDVDFCTYSYRKVGQGVAELFHKGSLLGEISVSLLGDFNLTNAAAATAVSIECGVPFDVVKEALGGFSGVARRLELIGEYKGRAVYYDYAHHPTEIREGIRALGSVHGGVTVVFLPHTYSRTAALWEDFTASLRLADYAIIGSIDGVREGKIEGISAERLARDVGAYYLSDSRQLLRLLDKTEGCVALMGAADMREIKNTLFPQEKT
ncbi:MAG: hypothetical protein IJD51_05515 [Clostridia bacterium]|nr:hypothetical protein [Clostridia bacterium]